MRIAIHTFAAAWLFAAVPSGAQTPSHGVNDKEIVLGSVMDLSGPTAPLGALVRAGIQFGFETINKAGGIHGRQVRLIIEDSGYDPKKAIVLTNKLLNEDKIFAMIAQTGSTIARVTMPLVEKENRAFLFPVALSAELYDPPRRLAFSTLSAYTLQTEAATRQLWDKMGKRRFCVLKQDDDTGEQVAAGVTAALKQRNAAVIETTSYKRGTTDFGSHFARMRSANCDVVMLGTTVREAAAAAIERRKIGWDVPLVANQASSGSVLIGIAGAAVDGVYGVSAYLPVGVVKDRREIAEVVQRYRDAHGEQIRADETFFVGYAAAVLFAEGARRAGRNLSTDSLVAGLEQIKDFDSGTPFATMSFAPGRRLASSTVFFMKVDKGAWTLVSELQ